MFKRNADNEVTFDDATHDRIEAIMRRLPRKVASILELELEDILIEIEDNELEEEEAEVEIHLLLADVKRDMRGPMRRPLC